MRMYVKSTNQHCSSLVDLRFFALLWTLRVGPCPAVVRILQGKWLRMQKIQNIFMILFMRKILAEWI